MRYFLSVLFLFPCIFLDAQLPPDSIVKRKVFGLTIQKGEVFIHKPSVASTKNAYPRTIGLEYAVHRVDYNSYSVARLYPRSGVALSFTDYNTPVLGYGGIVSWFLQPVYRIGNRVQFQFRGDIGFGYFSKPFDELTNNSNKSYSMHFTPYIHFGAGMGYRISDHITLQADGHFNHISNGHFKQPNAGLNWMMLSGTFLYYPESSVLPKHKFVRARRTNRSVEYDLGFMFVPGQGYHEQWFTKRNYMAGLFAQGSLPVSRINAVTLGTEVSYNRFRDADHAPKDYSKPSTTAGIHIGHEFLLGKMIFSQQIGKYFTKYPSFISGIYHRWGLRYELNKHWFAGFNLKAHKEAADLIDVRIQYRF